MSLQKTVHFLRQFRADSLGRGNVFHARFAQPIHRTKSSQQQILSVLANAWAIVENAFFNSFFQKQLVVGIGETVRFVANPLQQTQRAGVERKSQRKGTSRPINFFVLFRQTDDRQIV